MLIHCRQTASTVPVDCLVSYPKRILYWSRGSCAQFVQPVATMLSPFQSGNDQVGRTTPKVLSISLPPHGRSRCAGIWLSPSKDSPPVLTMFGSTNLNSRSAHFDTELSFVMVTSSQALQQTLHDEVRNLRRWAGPWKGADRAVRLRTKAIVGLVGGML